MESREEVPKKIRVKRCGNTVPVPLDAGKTEVLFHCQENRGHEGNHTETGLVDMGNGTVREYKIEWRDLGFMTTRLRKPRKLVVKAVKK